MKRGKKLCSLLAVLVLLLGATWLAARWDPENAAEETAGTTVFSLDADAVTNIRWDYSEELSFTKEADTWVYDEDPAFPLDTAYIDTMLANIRQITSTKTIEHVENWDQYTLEIPVCEITVTAAGTEHTLKIGEETSLGGERYLSIGDGNAYLVDAGILDAFSYGLYDVLAMEALPDMQTVTAMELQGQSAYRIDLREDSGLAYSDDYVWFLEDQPLDTDLTERLIGYVTNLQWQACVDYNASDPGIYGLDAPAATITVHYTREDEKQAFLLEIGSQTADGYYARISGSSMVYTISTAAAEKLLYTTRAELLPDEVLLMDWDQVTDMEVTLNGESYTFTRTLRTETTEDGTEVQTVLWKLDGAEVGAGSIPEALDGLESTGYATGLAPERSEEIRFVIRRDRETFPEVTLSIFQYNSTSCLVTLNGEATVFVDREDVVSLMEAVNDLVL